MLKVGDQIRLKKSMGAFTNIGEVCKVVDISDEAVISFRFGEFHLGCMSHDEFKKYFDKVDSYKYQIGSDKVLVLKRL